ncbi:MAG: hypothetical protein L3K26_20315, partial [Candidatus Hydrogenedentes bacterium]|nr:hypothetical protein [Candidatus Hydrogenedentota bacterium]
MSAVLRLSASLGCFVLAGASLAEPVSFGRDIRPILATQCFKCHGPDENTRQGGLRLDTFEGATLAAESETPAIVPGKPDEGLFLARLTTHDVDDRMPPPQVG